MKKALILYIFALMFLPVTSFGQVSRFVKEYSYRLEDEDSRNSAKIKAQENLRKLLLTEVLVYVRKSNASATSSSADISVNLYKEAITVTTQNKIKILEEKFDGFEYWIKGQIEANITEINTYAMEKSKVREKESAITAVSPQQNVARTGGGGQQGTVAALSGGRVAVTLPTGDADYDKRQAKIDKYTNNLPKMEETLRGIRQSAPAAYEVGNLSVELLKALNRMQEQKYFEPDALVPLIIKATLMSVPSQVTQPIKTNIDRVNTELVNKTFPFLTVNFNLPPDNAVGSVKSTLKQWSGKSVWDIKDEMQSAPPMDKVKIGLVLKNSTEIFANVIPQLNATVSGAGQTAQNSGGLSDVYSASSIEIKGDKYVENRSGKYGENENNKYKYKYVVASFRWEYVAMLETNGFGGCVEIGGIAKSGAYNTFQLSAGNAYFGTEFNMGGCFNKDGLNGNYKNVLGFILGYRQVYKYVRFTYDSGYNYGYDKDNYDEKTGVNNAFVGTFWKLLFGANDNFDITNKLMLGSMKNPESYTRSSGNVSYDKTGNLTYVLSVGYTLTKVKK